MSKESTGLVTYRLDSDNPPELSIEEKESWERLKAMRDEDIDFSDIPNQAGTTGWRRVSELVPADNKAQITLRLDADVLAFFRSTGRRYQSRINAALREYMLAHKPAR
jgi:uncharacterized protein (DUF4415 family)